MSMPAVTRAHGGFDLHDAGGGPPITHPEVSRIKVDGFDEFAGDDGAQCTKMVETGNRHAIDIESGVRGLRAKNDQLPTAIGRARNDRHFYLCPAVVLIGS